MKVSAVVPTYNDEDVIDDCLKSLFNQSREFNEIIVVDNASLDSTREIVSNYKVKNIFLEKNRERCYSRNMGWKNATGDIVAIIESDCVYENDWVENILKKFESGAKVVLDKRRVYKPNTLLLKLTDEMFKIRLVEGKYKPFSAWIFRKEVLEDLYGFDDTFVGVEDLELGKRVIQNGYEITYAPDAVCYHQGEAKTVFQNIKRNWWFGKHRLNYYKKYSEDFPFVTFGIFTFLPFLVFIPKLLLIALSVLYLRLFVKAKRLGLSFELASFYPIASVSSNVSFVWGFYYSVLMVVLKALRRS